MFFKASLALAGLEITEVMYDASGTDTNNEWIEVHNTGTNSLDLSTFSVADFDTAWHFHTIVPDTVSTLAGGAYAIITTSSKLPDFISNFRSKWNSINPLFFRASFSLPNESGEISTSSDKKSIESDISYGKTMGAAGDGNTLQNIGGVWKASLPTPGEINKLSDNGNSNNNQNNSSGGSGAGTVSINSSYVNKSTVKPELSVTILTPSIATTGVDLHIESKVTYGSTVYKAGKLLWNFGDGSTFEQELFEPIVHKYKYPGDYVITVSYMKYKDIKIPDATDRTIVTVSNPGINISSIGDSNDFYVELSNTSDFELSLSDWMLKNNDQIFKIPEGTIILPNKKLMFGSELTGFLFNVNSAVSVLKPSGQVAYDYPLKSAPKDYNYSYKKYNDLNIGNTGVNKIEDNIIDLSEGELTAQAANTESGLPLEVFGVFALIVLGIISTYFFMNKKSETNDISLDSGDDIRIIE